MTVYHGSNTVIEKISIDKCRPYRDFGRGFYTTVFEEQAIVMARRTVRIYGGKPRVTVFTLDESCFNDPALRIRKFPEPGEEWALFVLNNRNSAFTELASPECNTDGKYDIVSGPVANDNLVALFNLFATGTLSRAALAVEMTYRKLTNQISFHTARAVSFLNKAGTING